MRILPVLDLLGGVVVRGVAGEREQYRPIEGVRTGSAEPLAVAAALRDEFGIGELYVADLDGILHRRPRLDVVRRLRAAGFRCQIDAGVRSPDETRNLFDAGAESVIVCLETQPQGSLLRGLIGEFGAERLIFSIDLRGGELMGLLDEDPAADAFRVAKRVTEYGFRRLILLDLAAVGVGAGPATLELCRQVRAMSANLELITGGGVRNRADLDAFAAAGADAVLLASALHSGMLSRADLQEYR